MLFRSVVATNGTQVTENAVTVGVNDVNDNAPVFVSGATGSVNENVAAGSAIYVASTTDGDGTSANRGVVYSLKAETGDAGVLSINPATGAVSLATGSPELQDEAYMRNLLQKLLKDGGTATTSSTAAPKSAAKPN